ncbi:MAG: metallophosphoesterase [Flavobacterium sp.]
MKTTLPKIVSFLLTALVFLLQSCASHKMQLHKNSNKNQIEEAIDSSKIDHTFFLIGDAGNADQLQAQQTLHSLEAKLTASGSNATLLFLGDNIYPKGMPADKDNPDYPLAKVKLQNQLELAKNFKGKTIVIPGNHDWYSGLKGLENQAKFVNGHLKDKSGFLPGKGCPIDAVKIDKKTILITIDSEWFLVDWDNYPGINDDCEIKTREGFFEELESILNKNQDKIKIIPMHHPLMSNGSHGGQYSLEKQLYPFESNFPLPVIGSFINLLRKTSGASPEDLQNKQYQILSKRIIALLQGQDNVVVVSGHDHNLQYIEKDNIIQVISGAGSKSEAAKAVGKNDFSYGGNGFAMLSVLKNGEMIVSYHGMENGSEKLLWQHSINQQTGKEIQTYPSSFPTTTTASIYTKKMTDKTIFHDWLLGSHYKDLYSTPIAAKTATLDTLYGGLKPTQAGGGHQSKSLRLKDNDGKEFVMRALKKSAARFLQSVAFKDQYVEKEFENTYAENFLLDFYTTSHPYTPFVVGDMAGKIGVSHTNPELYFIPKHKDLKDFNADFGDELYMVEERPTDSQKDLVSFGKPDAIIGTDDLLKNLQKDEKYSVDEPAYIKARLFDMLIGDWDRHFDQWRWGEYKVGEKVIYKPIPRDRDQAFSKYDGAILAIVMNIPDLRHMQTFKSKISNVKWFNREPYPLDVAFLKNSSANDWKTQAQYIQDHLSVEDISEAFKKLPAEMQDTTIESIKEKLSVRKNDLQKYAAEYFKVLQKTILIVGTNKKDKFVIKKNKQGLLEIEQYRIKKEAEELVNSRIINDKNTNEVWIYGLDDDDVFIVEGKEKSTVKIRLIGGQNHDNYHIENGKRVYVYDFKSKQNTYQVDGCTHERITDDYQTNMYDYKKPKFNAWTGLPGIGYNPDDGVKIGAVVNYTKNGFKQNPYTQKHTFKANYYFATNGFELMYKAKIPQAVGKWDFEMESRVTSANFAINYFGYGNETVNNDEDTGMDYNRVRIQQYRIAPLLKKVGRFGSELSFQASLESIEVEETTNRFINIPGIVNPAVFEPQQFLGTTVAYSFENYDNKSNPTLGMGFALSGSWKMNLNDSRRNFPQLESKLNFNHKIDANGNIVLATLLKGKMLLNDNFEFYQGAALGGDYDLRGFRNERFLGKQSFFQSSDLRISIGRIKGSLVPMTYGLLGGFDYGRVWLDGETSNTWHRSYGGGLWLNGLKVITARITYFKSEIDNARIAFGLGFGF